LTSYIGVRLLHLFPVLLAVSVITFGLIFLAPGDPAEVYLRSVGQMATPEAVSALRREWGLDEPIPVQYARWVGRVVQLDFGTSLRTGEPVAQAILARMPNTILLGGAAITLALLLSIPLGILAAVFRNTATDAVCRFFALFGAAVPNFWLAFLLILYISVRLRWLPTMGTGSWRHLVLPASVLALGLAASYARLLRASLAETLGQDYVRTARAKGLPAWLVVLRHALRNALIPFVTVLGLSLGHLLGGSVVVESIFSWPGLGKFAWDSIMTRDYPAVQGVVLTLAVLFVTANLLVDLSYRLLDPKVKLANAEADE
jgi:peptide/nickel transport system permease protein